MRVRVLEKGSFDKKWLILAIVEGNTKGKDPLGKVVINLSDYASQEDSGTISFTVQLSKSMEPEKIPCRLIVSIEYVS